MAAPLMVASILTRSCARSPCRFCPLTSPSGADKTIAALQGIPYTLTTADFGFTDSDDVPPNNLLAVKLTTLPLSGSFTLSGAAVIAGQFVSATDIGAGKLQFVPPVTANANPFTSFTFQVQDDGGTANDGIDLDPSPNTLTFNSLRPAGPPEGLDAERTINEDWTYYFAPADFAFGGTNANLLGIWITSLPTAGTLRRSQIISRFRRAAFFRLHRLAI